MAVKRSTIEKYMVQLRRIEEHREKNAEKNIRKLYKKMLKETQEFLGVEYAKLAVEGRLTYETLSRYGEYARFLEEVETRLNGLSTSVSKEIRTTVEEVYALSYKGMVEAVEKVKFVSKFEQMTGFADVAHKQKAAQELAEALAGIRNVPADVIKAAVENPISGLTLDDILEKNRKEIIYDIKQQIGTGLRNGDRFETMANRISDSLDGDYNKAVRITRTEVHRVREAGHIEAANRVDETLKESSVAARMTKTWRTMADERVRPNRGKGKKPAKNPKADHVKMDGVTVYADEKFDLGRGIKTTAPGQSGDAANDINCRCFLEYDLEIK